jgi:hypothetical protein
MRKLGLFARRMGFQGDHFIEAAGVSSISIAKAIVRYSIDFNVIFPPEA